MKKTTRILSILLAVILLVSSVSGIVPSAATVITKFDLTNSESYANLNVVEQSKTNKVYQSASGLALGWSELHNRSGLEKAYIVIPSIEGKYIKVTVYKNAYYSGLSAWNNEDYTIKIYTSATTNFSSATAQKTIVESVTDASGNITFTVDATVPIEHKYIKIEFPQTGSLQNCDGSHSNPVCMAANDMFQIRNIEFYTPDVSPYSTFYDFTTQNNNQSTLANAGVVAQSSGNGKIYQSANGLSLGWSELHNRSNLSKPYFTLAVPNGKSAIIKVYKNAWYAGMSQWNNANFTIEAYTSSTTNFTGATAQKEKFNVTTDVSGNETFYINVSVPEGHNYIKVVFPQTGALMLCSGSSCSCRVGNDMFYVQGVEFYVPGKEKVSKVEHLTQPETMDVYYKSSSDFTGLKTKITYASGRQETVQSGYYFDALQSRFLGEGVATVKFNEAPFLVPINVFYYTGDFNCDESVDVIDLIRLKKITAGTAQSNAATPDINGDASTNATDLTEFMKYLLGASQYNLMTKYSGENVTERNFDFNGSISLEVLNNYLNRAVRDCTLLVGDEIENNERIRFITNTGIKYAQRSYGEWIVNLKSENNYPALKDAIEKAHEIDPDIIFEAAVYECITGEIWEIQIPDWVFEAFGLEPENRHFVVEDTLFTDGYGLDIHGGNMHAPDITRLETQMFYYYKACKYIDLGFEALHMGQTLMTGKNDTNFQCWTKVINMIREYAKTHARRGYVIINSHDRGNLKDSKTGNMLVDFIMSPSRVHPASSETETYAPTETRPQRCIIEKGYWDDSPYQAGFKGTSPSGWYTNKYPYLTELDNYGNGIPGGTANLGNPKSYVWGLDESSWFFCQPDWYRIEFIHYMLNTIDGFNENGHFALYCSTSNSNPYTGKTDNIMVNNRSEDCPDGKDEEQILKEIFANR